MVIGLSKSISYAARAKSIHRLSTGYSKDEKYILDNRYLVRMFPLEDVDERKLEFESLAACSTYSSYVPEALEFGTLQEDGKAYMVLSYIAGEDGEEVLYHLTEDEQYDAGYAAGVELANIHQMPAPGDWPA